MKIHFALAVAALLAATPVLADSQANPPAVPADEIIVQDAWARASAGAATTGAAYVTLKAVTKPDRLIGVSTPVAGMAQVHDSVSEGGIMRMRGVPVLQLPAGKTVALSPGGYHIMLMDLMHPLTAGQTFPLTLSFEHAGSRTVDVQVRAIGAASAGGHDQMQMK